MPLTLISDNPLVQVHELLVAESVTCLSVGKRCGRALYNEGSQAPTLRILVGQPGQRFHV
jgi:hypothetical protein